VTVVLLLKPLHLSVDTAAVKDLTAKPERARMSGCRTVVPLLKRLQNGRFASETAAPGTAWLKI
jgi:hypothetical protein